jgi:hypothetical protein
MSAFHEAVAKDISGMGGILQCPTCKNKFPLAEGRVGGFLAHGWPKCCGLTMEWITDKQLRERRKVARKPKD